MPCSPAGVGAEKPDGGRDFHQLSAGRPSPAQRLHDLLRAEGVEAWYDAHVGPGQDWRITTAKALEDCRIFVLLFSANASQSSDIAKKLAAATLEKKLIIPVRLENIAPKGAFLYELASRNWVNAYENTEDRLAELAKGLAHLVRTGARDESVLPFEWTPVRRKFPSRSALIGAAVVVITAATAIAAWLLWPVPRWTVESSRPFIASLALEDFPAFSPNGASIAYTLRLPKMAAARFLCAILRKARGIKIASDTYDDTSPTWSSDGARLAYVAIKPGEPCRIMMTTVPAGEVREAGRCRAAEASTISWQPGTPYVYSVERGGLKGDVIFKLNLDTGAREIVVAKPALRDIITGLRCSPDGNMALPICSVANRLSFMTYRMVRKKPWATFPRAATGTPRSLGRRIPARS